MVWDEIKNEIKAINGGKENNYGKDYIKIKFNSDDDLPLNKPLKFYLMNIIIRSVFEEDGELYPQVKMLKKYSTVKMLQYEKIDVSEGIDVNKTSAAKECMLCHYWYYKDVGLRFEPHICNKCHDVLMKSAYELRNIAILNVKCVNFRCILWVLVGMRLLIAWIIPC